MYTLYSIYTLGKCVLVQKITGLEEICLHGQILAFLTFILFIAAEVDKRVKFHKVLAVEYMLTMKNFSNMEYIFRSWFPFVTGIVTFLIFYTSYIYKNFQNNKESLAVVRFFFVHAKVTRQYYRFQHGFESLLSSSGKMFLHFSYLSFTNHFNASS